MKINRDLSLSNSSGGGISAKLRNVETHGTSKSLKDPVTVQSDQVKISQNSAKFRHIKCNGTNNKNSFSIYVKENKSYS